MDFRLVIKDRQGRQNQEKVYYGQVHALNHPSPALSNTACYAKPHYMNNDMDLPAYYKLHLETLTYC